MQFRNPALQEIIENYFSFSRSQRRAIALIVFFAAMLLAYVKVYNANFVSAHAQEPFVVSEVVHQLAVRDSLQPIHFNRYNSESNFSFNPSVHPNNDAIQPGRLFEFDPNTAAMEDLLELGLSEKAAMNLINYREKGGRFRKPEDLSKLYSLKPVEAQRLIPYVRITEPPILEENKQYPESNIAEIPKEFIKKNRIEIGPVDVNLADSLLWQMLPGIGAKRASAILRYRERLGGFIRIEQVAEVAVLPDSVFQKILPGLTIGGGDIERLSINTATEAELKAHPYIGWQWAKIIVAYRNQHGAYKTVDDLLKIHVVKKDWLEKVRPYLKVD